MIRKISFILALAMVAVMNCATAQVTQTVSGFITDQNTGQPIGIVDVHMKGSSLRTVSSPKGEFSIAVPADTIILFFTHVSYKPKEMKVTGLVAGINNLLHIELETNIIGLSEVRVISSYATERKTPIAATTIPAQLIERRMGNQDFPEIMKNVPGVYATKAGGGNGDARLTIRGFQQENIALLLNGVPVSSVESGLVYWSNWVGLADATQAIQVQRGLGASQVSLNSVGGTVNIITKTTEAAKGGTLRYSVSDYGNAKVILSLSTGKMKNGYAVTFLGSHTKGPGYVNATYVNAWAYFLSVSKEFGLRHKLVFTVLGSPERHGQRNYGMSKSDYNAYGNKYNSSWGMYNGKVLNLSENFYHKPQISLNHYWNISPKAFLATSAYVSFGAGGGKYTEAFNFGKPTTAFTRNNQIDWDAVYQNNVANTDSVQLATGNYVKNYSKNILTNFLASHVWTGVLSSLTWKASDNLKLISGVHARYFKSHLREEVADLMGGKSWIDNYVYSSAGVSGRNQVKGIGDVINVDNYSEVNIASAFSQAEYTRGALSIFAAASLSNTWYRRTDPYNYVTNNRSQLVSKTGFDVKTGANFNFDEHHNAYINAGMYSREPYFNFVFVQYSNALVNNLKNEKIKAVELGYGFTGGKHKVHLNAYYTLWEDKSILTRQNIQLPDSLQPHALIRGLDALHKGIECEYTLQMTHNLQVELSFSIADWRWKNDVFASLYSDNQELVDTMLVYANGLRVGDAPQTQAALQLSYILPGDFDVSANYMYCDRLYANFDPATRNIATDRAQPYRIPAYGLLDLHLGYTFNLGELPVYANLSCFNVMNKEKIMRGDDGAMHDLDSFKGFWTLGRTFNMAVKISF
ncbi:MAG: TonB-dependent receptor [Bacteroidales bacterium]